MRRAEIQQKYIPLMQIEDEEDSDEDQTNLMELSDLIPTFLNPELQVAVKQQIDQRETRIDNTELNLAFSLINSEDFIQIHKGLVIFRKFVSQIDDQDEQLMNNFLNFENIIPKFIQIAKGLNIPLFSYEVAWILSNIASGTLQQVSLIVENGGLSLLIQLLQSQELIIANQAAWGIANIAAENSQFRIIAQNQNVIPKVINLISRNVTIKNIETCVWCLRNVCLEFIFSQEGSGYALLIGVIEAFCQVIKNCSKPPNHISQRKQFDSLEYCLEGLLPIVNKFIFLHHFLMDTGLIPDLIALIGHELLYISNLSLDILVVIITTDNNDEILDYILQQDLLNSIIKPLQRKDQQRSEKIFRILNKILVGSGQQLNQVIKNKVIMSFVFKRLNYGYNSLITEILCLLCQKRKSSSQEQLNFLINQGLFDSIMHYLQQESKNEVGIAGILINLQLLNIILKEGIADSGQVNVYVPYLNQINGINILKQLQTHPNQYVAKLSSRLLHIYQLE